MGSWRRKASPGGASTPSEARVRAAFTQWSNREAEGAGIDLQLCFVRRFRHRRRGPAPSPRGLGLGWTRPWPCLSPNGPGLLPTDAARASHSPRPTLSDRTGVAPPALRAGAAGQVPVPGTVRDGDHGASHGRVTTAVPAMRYGHRSEGGPSPDRRSLPLKHPLHHRPSPKSPTSTQRRAGPATRHQSLGRDGKVRPSPEICRGMGGAAGTPYPLPALEADPGPTFFLRGHRPQ